MQASSSSNTNMLVLHPPPPPPAPPKPLAPPEGEVSISTVKNVETSVGMKSNVDLLVAFESKQRVDIELTALLNEKEELNKKLRSQMKLIADHQEEFAKLDERLDDVSSFCIVNF